MRYLKPLAPHRSPEYARICETSGQSRMTQYTRLFGVKGMNMYRHLFHVDARPKLLDVILMYRDVVHYRS